MKPLYNALEMILKKAAQKHANFANTVLNPIFWGGARKLLSEQTKV